MLVTREREGRERKGRYGEGIGGAYFESGEEFWGLGFGGKGELLALEKVPWVRVGVAVVFSFGILLLLLFFFSRFKECFAFCDRCGAVCFYLASLFFGEFHLSVMRHGGAEWSLI